MPVEIPCERLSTYRWHKQKYVVRSHEFNNTQLKAPIKGTQRGQVGQIQINHFIFRNDPGELQDADYNIFIAKHNKVVMKL